MAETLRAKFHRVLGGAICRARGEHRLVLAEHHWYERTGLSHTDATQDGLRFTLHEIQHRSARRPMCTTCWQMPGD